MRLSRSLDLIFETHSPARLIPAIAWNGKVYQADPGSTSHFDALNKVPIDQRQAATLDGDNRVFVNERGRVMNRYRAMRYALENDLISPSAPSYARTSRELIGEWLKSTDELTESSTMVDGTRVWKNPSLAQINAIINRAGWDEGKALLSGNDLYVWDGRREHHMDIIRKLGLPQSNAFNRTGKLYLFRDENGRIGLHFNKPDEHDDPMSDRGLWKEFGTGTLEHPMVQRLVRQGIHVPEYARQTVIHESVKLDTFVANWRGGTGRYDTRFYRKIHNGETLDDENGKAIAVKDRLEPIRPIESWIPAQKRSGVIFRGMSAQEYANVLRTGEIRSNGSYNIGDQQAGLTYYSTEPDSAASYATSFAPSQHAPTFDQPAYVVGVHMPDQNRIRYVKGTGEHEVGVIGPIPVLDIIEVYRAIVIEQGAESYMTRVHWEKIR